MQFPPHCLGLGLVKWITSLVLCITNKHPRTSAQTGLCTQKQQKGPMDAGLDGFGVRRKGVTSFDHRGENHKN